MFYKSFPSFYSEESVSAESSEMSSSSSNEEVNESEEAELSPLDALKAELAEAKSKYNDTYERMMRIAADADNTRKRLEKEKMESRLYAIQDFAKDLLPVIDAFDKAMLSIEESSINFESEEGKKVAAIVEGFQLVTKVFQDATKKHGIERLPGKGTPFNPMFHNAIAKVADESLTQETVIDEFMAGYKIGDRVLRTAMVRVGSPD